MVSNYATQRAIQISEGQKAERLAQRAIHEGELAYLQRLPRELKRPDGELAVRENIARINAEIAEIDKSIAENQSYLAKLLTA